MRYQGEAIYRLTLSRLQIAPKPYLVWFLGAKALKSESLEPKGN